MKASHFPHLFLLFLVLAFCFTCASSASGEDDFEAMQKKMVELARKLGETSDPAESAKIKQELTELTVQMFNQLPTWDLGMLEAQGKTPEEEVDLRMEVINRSHREARKSIYQLRDETKPPVPLVYASKVRGSIVVTGKDSELSTRGWVWVDLNYKVEEEFVGYLMVTEYYDPKTGQFLDRKDYAIHSISTGIRVLSETGKQCVGLTSYIPHDCTGWEEYTTYDPNKEDAYPYMHSWVILGSPEGDNISIEVESPSIYFRSANNRAGRALGCYGTKFEIPKSDFERDLQMIGELQVSKDVGRKSSGSPRCDMGSAIELKMNLCDPRLYAEDRCEQLESLLADMKALIKLRNTYKEMAGRAKDVNHLNELLIREMTRVYPDKDWGNKFKQDSGGYNFCNGEITLPDYCKGCIPSPMCEWYSNGVDIHEQTHQRDAPNNMLVKEYSCDTSFVPTDLQNKEIAKKWAEMDYHAYGEQLKYYLDVLAKELNAHRQECQFKSSFYPDYVDVVNEIEKIDSK
jgi:hypothetical protein